MNNMKKNIAIGAGIVALLIVLIALFNFLRLHAVKSDYVVHTDKTEIKNESEKSGTTQSFTGDVIREFEGSHKLSYSFDIPKNATTEVGMDGALIKITEGSDLFAAVYMSYEGGRGYSPTDYIDNVIAPKVSVISHRGSETVGFYDWQVAESETSEWYVTSIKNGEWLAVVENKKAMHDNVGKTLQTLMTTSN